MWDCPTLLESVHDAGRLEWYAYIHLVAGGSSTRSSLKFHVAGAGGNPNVAVWQMLDPPSHFQSKSCLWNVSPLSLELLVRLKRMTHQGLLLWLAGSSSGDDARWPWMWPRGSKITSHTPALTCNASSADGWWSFPHSTLPSCTTDS